MCNLFPEEEEQGAPGRLMSRRIHSTQHSGAVLDYGAGHYRKLRSVDQASALRTALEKTDKEPLLRGCAHPPNPPTSHCTSRWPPEQ